VLRGILGPERDRVRGGCRDCHNVELHNLPIGLLCTKWPITGMGVGEIYAESRKGDEKYMQNVGREPERKK
jgi:hypothetical protein